MSAGRDNVRREVRRNGRKGSVDFPLAAVHPSPDHDVREMRSQTGRRRPSPHRLAQAPSVNLSLLTVVASQLGPDELDVLVVVAERLKLGRTIYGQLELASDQRDFAGEAFEEMADALVYRACVELKRARRVAFGSGPA